MIHEYILNQPGFLIQSDPASEFPVYIYWSNDKMTLLYSRSISELLNDGRVPNSLKLSDDGISFLLQSGVVPTPKTVYKNIFIVGIGDKAQVSTVNGKIDVQFSHEFPYSNLLRLAEGEMKPNEDFILQTMAEATINRIDSERPSFLFHSAGKDSNIIALALAEAGWQDKVTLVTHKSKGGKDESEISKKIAKDLGFKHQILHEVDNLTDFHKEVIQNYFSLTPLPNTDNVSLAYPLYSLQIPELKGANLIDGMGNDVFIGHIPGVRELRSAKVARYTGTLGWIGDFFGCTSHLFAATRTRVEKVGFSGFSWPESERIYSKSVNISKLWKQQDKDFRSVDYLDVRSELRGGNIDQEVFMRKVRNFADAYDANLIFPWTNREIANYFSTMPEAELFRRKELRNKLILRKILKNRIGLDSDLLGKMGFSYDFRGVLRDNISWFRHQILKCNLWEPEEIERFVNKLQSQSSGINRKSEMSRKMIYRLFLISIWFNQRESAGLLNV